MNRLIDRYSVVFVAVAATMWALDAYLRNQLICHLQPTEIVVAEDALMTLFLLFAMLSEQSGRRKHQFAGSHVPAHRGEDQVIGREAVRSLSPPDRFSL
jgi:hypothetical protein